MTILQLKEMEMIRFKFIQRSPTFFFFYIFLISYTKPALIGWTKIEHSTTFVGEFFEIRVQNMHKKYKDGIRNILIASTEQQ